MRRIQEERGEKKNPVYSTCTHVAAQKRRIRLETEEKKDPGE
jgi:hypothetical protein